MKLIIAIIQDDYINDVVEELMANKIRITKLSSTGGFLKSGSTTLLIGVKKEEKDKVVSLIESKVVSRNVKSSSGEVKLGGANLFVMDMDQMIKI